MDIRIRILCISIFFATFFNVNAQEGLPIYSDYLTDNYYLLYPSMAGVSNCGKVRLTGRKQWFDHEKAPELQTISVNTRIGDSRSAIGAIAFNDVNGYHSQSGAYLTYAHHILFSRSELDLDMLSFGISAGMIQYKLDETSFLAGGFDPIIAGIEQSATDFNIDFGFSYQYLEFYAHASIKNLLNNDGINFNEQGLSYNNLRTYLFSTGYLFNSSSGDWNYEPSIMFAYKDATQETFLDTNFKVYRETDFGRIWAGLSYRRSFDGAEYLNSANQIRAQKLEYITPLLGLEFNGFVFAYNYSYQSNSVVFDNGGYHQITLGFNFGCRKERYDCECPWIK
ncbi:MAG: type IX secretion system membrane protein PorP/SprF [Bacteroidota bacterium]|nr:type IX secretion system membrane protein PorP/SprF [Bacteroidota bacterium]|tara:strand:+ start:444 stop:1457 length:1014 start_codon:yes stop_codon:yes gene_type:complete